MPGITVVHAIDASDLSVADKEKIQQRTYTQAGALLWNAHEILKNKEVGELGVTALVRVPIPYHEDLVRGYLEDNGLLGTSFDQSIKYTLTPLEDNSKVFEPSLVADGAVCWVHDIGNEPPLSTKEYWMPAEERQAE